MIPGTNVRSAERLREDFDRTFEAPVRAADPMQRDFVLVSLGRPRVSGGKIEQVALPVLELCGIEHGAVVPAPSRVRALLGLAGVQGVALPVFSLGLLMGMAEAPDKVNDTWRRAPVFALAEVAGQGRVCLAFERLLQFVRVGESSLYRDAGSVSGALSLSHEDELYPVVDVRALLARLVGVDGQSERPEIENR